MIRFAIKEFSLKDNAYKVIGMLPGGFHGTVSIGMTESLESVLTKLNALSGAVQTNFLPLWLNAQPMELPKKNEETEKNVPLIVGTEDSSTTEKREG